MRNALIALLLSVSVSAAQAAPATRADKAFILDWARNTLADPYSLRSTEISDVTQVGPHSVICIGFNARNQAGGYTGLYRQAFAVTPTGLVHGGRYGRGITTGTCWEPQVVMKPFPELSAIK